MPRPQASWWSPTAICFVLLWLGLLTLAPGAMLGDPGTLWHTVVGEQILDTGRLPQVDEFSFSAAGQPWIAQQWIGEVVMALLYQLGGLDLLVLATVTLLVAVYALLFERFLRAGLPWLVATVLIMLVLAASSYHFLPRPHVATIAFMAVLFMLLTDVEAGRRDVRWLLALPPLFVLWTNTHGGALGGLATLLVVALGWLVLGLQGSNLARLLHGEVVGWRGLRRVSCPLLVLAVGLSLASVLVNPYGPALPRVWVGLMNSPILPQLIIEHAPLRLTSVEGGVIMALAGVYLLALLDAGRRGLRVTWLVPLLWLGMSLSRIRHGPLFAVCAAVAIADLLPHSRMLKAYLERIHRLEAGAADPGRSETGVKRGWAAPATLVGLAVALQVAGVRCPVIGAGWSTLSPSQWPVEAVAALRRCLPPCDRPVRVFNHLSYGGYLIFAVPETRIYIDDRCELYRDDGLLRYVRLAEHPAEVDALAAYEAVDFALVRAGGAFDRHFTGGSVWRLVHRDQTAVLFAHAPAAVASR